jgi:predicted  nucleic acid-binding Zn-ribbon protein
MKDKIDILKQLQAIEIETNKLKGERERSLAAKGRIDERLLSFEQDLNAERARFDQTKKEYRQKEMDILANQSLIEKSQQKLRSVKTNKEYQSMLKEIDELKSKNSKIEDDMLEYLEEMEVLEKSLEVLKQDHQAYENEANKEKDVIEANKKECERRQAEMTSKWEEASHQADPDLLKTYMIIKSSTDGIALASASNEMCNGCHLNIPPQLFNELLKDNELILCPHCHRILYRDQS